MRSLLSTVSEPRFSRRLRINFSFDFAGVTGAVDAVFEAFEFVRMQAQGQLVMEITFGMHPCSSKVSCLSACSGYNTDYKALGLFRYPIVLALEPNLTVTTVIVGLNNSTAVRIEGRWCIGRSLL